MKCKKGRGSGSATRRFVEALEERVLLAPMLVKDINGTPADTSNLQPLLEYNNILYFTAATPEAGTELWRSDGTAAGTLLLKDIQPGTGGSFPRSMVLFQGMLYFSAFNSATGRELWRTDGAPEGTQLVKDLFPGDNNGNPDGVDALSVVNDRLLFHAYVPATGREWYSTDGTDAGTQLIKDLAPGPTSGVVWGFGGLPTASYVFNGRLAYAGTDGTSGNKLWVTDGTADGTLAAGPSPSTGAGSMVDFNNDLYYVSGSQLWRLGASGTAARITDGGVSAMQVAGLTVAAGKLFFIATGTSGSFLWQTDGTLGSTMPTPGVGPAPAQLTNNGGRLFFVVTDAAGGRELASTTGTSDSYHVYDIRPGSSDSNPSALIANAGILYFTADDGTATGRELWKSDGLSASLVYDIDPSGSAFSTSVNPFFVVGSRLWFRANDGVHGQELWQIAPPVSNAGSGYSVEAGRLLQLDGRGSSHPDPGEHLQYLWDLDGDGLFGETGPAASRGNETGATPTFSSSDLPPGTFPVQLRVTDSIGLDSLSTAQITITPPPFINFSADAAVDWSGTPGARILTLHAGALTLSADLSSVYPGVSLIIDNAATVHLPAVQHLKQLTLLDSATLDLDNASLFVLASQPQDTLASIRSLIKSGRIVSNAAQANANSGIGYAFDSTSGSVRVMPTILGDLNLDHTVSISDFLDLSSHFSQSNANWSDGDVNYDDQVSIADFLTLASNFGQTDSPAAPQPQPAAAAVATQSSEKVLPVHRVHSHHRRRDSQMNSWSATRRRWMRNNQ